MRTVLFLIADTGSGHRSAANAILEAMIRCNASEDLAPNGADRPCETAWQGLIIDVFSECARLPLRKGVSLYGSAITYAPRLFGKVFRTTDSPDRFAIMLRICRPLLASGLRDLLLRTRPDVVVSIHPLLNHFPMQVLRELDAHPRFVTVVTDLVDIHCGWITPDVDVCIVPTVEARCIAIERGLSSERVHLLGIPIDPRFTERRRSVLEARSQLGLDPRLPTVLIVGGGEGAGGLSRAAHAILGAELDAQVVIITGRNRRLFQELRCRTAQSNMPVHLLGFVDNMWDYMHAADIIVSKAGPGTISEAIACELPIILMGAVPGQETGNVKFVVENGFGRLVDNPSALRTYVASLLSPAGRDTLESMRSAARRFGHPGAAMEIARVTLSLLSPKNQEPQREAASRRPCSTPDRAQAPAYAQSEIQCSSLGPPAMWPRRHEQIQTGQ